MTTLRASEPSRSEAPRTAADVRVWGLSLTGVHDRFWASRRVQVIRSGVGAERVEAPGPALYLLVDRHELVFFELAPVIKRLTWLKPRAMRVRLVDADDSAYVERVNSEEDGRLRAIRREYGARTRHTAQVIVTPSASMARAWAGGGGGREARRSVYSLCGRRAVGAISIPGRVFDARAHDDAPLLFEELIRRWRRPETMIDGVYSFQPGVWLHESVQMRPGVRFVGPLWIGAGVAIQEGDVIVGPRVAPDDGRGASAPRKVQWDELSTTAWRLSAKHLRPRRLFGKRAFDIAFSLSVLLATLPLFPLVILAIMIEDGWPPFFAHTRQTVRGREFPCLKFRTMRKNAEAMKEELAKLNQADGPQFFIDDDPRLLKVGKLLRKTQLDEIPQFINVLLGHMSVVGPRPSPDKENQYCPAWREARLSVRPGVTGLWQVRRTREPQTDFQEWIRYDLEYVQHRSWRLDMVIILQTVKKIVGG